nr:hypothetical protein [Pedobacter roseus]
MFFFIFGEIGSVQLNKFRGSYRIAGEVFRYLKTSGRYFNFCGFEEYLLFIITGS